MKILDIPLPFLLGAYVPPQFPQEMLPDMPSWVATFLLGIWATGWFAEKFGKFPSSKEQASPQAQKIIELLEALTKEVDDLSKAVTELRVELANKD